MSAMILPLTPNSIAYISAYSVRTFINGTRVLWRLLLVYILKEDTLLTHAEEARHDCLNIYYIRAVYVKSVCVLSTGSMPIP